MTTLATDPPVSEKQRRAMYAAASGHSTLGIPKKVGREFVGKDSALRAAGVLFATFDGLGLFVRRSSVGDHAGEWCLPGGKMEDGEDAADAARREAIEEVGDECVLDDSMRLVHRAVSDEDVDFSTFVQPTRVPFVPRLDAEHTAYAWAPVSDPPQPLHPGVLAMLRSDDVEDAAYDWKPVELRAPFMMRTREHVEMAFDRAASVRKYDVDGRLHVSTAHISKANICEYLGKEIPGWQELGLRQDQKYRLLRDPEELARAAHTFNNLPILDRHVPVSAESHAPEFVIGSTGTDAEFGEPYLDNSLVFWAGPAIDAIEDETQRELSCAYRYRPDMTPGVYKGENYDGVMRDIVGNHVALVKEGRAGDDVVVGDSKENLMTDKTKPVRLTPMGLVTMGALAAYLRPKMAQDAKVLIVPALAGLTGKNFKERKAGIVTEVTKLLSGKLAKDAGLTDMPGVLDALEATTDPNGALPMSEHRKEGMDDDPAAYHHPVIAYLQTLGLAPEVVTKVHQMLESEETAEGQDTPPPTPGTPPAPGAPQALVKKAGDKEPEPTQRTVDAADPDKEKKDEHAMDEKIKKATAEATAAATQIQREIRDAERAVRPWVGDLTMSFDSAAGVYVKALEMTGGMPSGVTSAAGAPVLKALLEQRRKPGERVRNEPVVAADAANAKSHDDRWPSARRIGRA